MPFSTVENFCQSPLQYHFTPCLNHGMTIYAIWLHGISKNCVYRSWKSVFSNWIADQSYLFWMAKLNWGIIYFAECNHKIMKKSCLELSQFIYVVFVLWLIFIMECVGSFLIGWIISQAPFLTLNYTVVSQRPSQLKNLVSLLVEEAFKGNEMLEKALACVAIYKYGKMTQSCCGESCSNWIDTFIEIYQELHCRWS